MKDIALTFPEFSMAVGTRVALGMGVGLLISSRFNRDERKGAGLALVLVGVLTTIPIVLGVLGKRSVEKPLALAS
jgi:hypothetical protein